MLRRSSFSAAVVGFSFLASSGSVKAQEPRSVSAAKELVQALDSGKLAAVAAKVPSESDQFAAALYFPGQLLVVIARYSVPQLLDQRLAKRDYREIYIELNSASDPATRILIVDAGADGLRPERSAGVFDSWDRGTDRVAFDGEWDRQKLSEAEYDKRFATADEEYARILGLLLTEAKKGS